MPCDY